ncbi:MAG: selenide, water dikinase SelD, partial [Leucothrix sp.]
GCSPGGASRNFESYGYALSPLDDEKRSIVCDPQTSGGLLVAVDPNSRSEFLQITGASGLDLKCIGEIVASGSQEHLITVS